MVNSAFVSSICSVQSVQSLCGKDDVLFGKDDRFLYLLFFFVFCLSLPKISLPMSTLHTNEGGTYTEHVQTY